MGLYLSWAVPWMEDKSTSIGTNLLVILFWMLQGTLIAFYLSIISGDVLFGHGWRAQMFDHEPLDLNDANLELGLLSKRMRARTFQFSILYTLCAVFVLLVSNFAAGDFFSHYQQVSYYKTVFRGDKLDLKVEALEKMGESWGPELIERTPIVLSVLEQDDDSILYDKAFEAISGIAYTVRAAANPRAHKSAGKAQQWKHKVAEQIREGALTRMQLILASSDNSTLRERAWMVLATVAPGALITEARLTKDRVLNEEDRVTLVLGLNWLGNQEILSVLTAELADNRHLQTRIAALWALGNFFRQYEAPAASDGEPEASVQSTLDHIAKLLDSDQLDLRCAALASLAKAGDVRLLQRFLSILEESSDDDLCKTQEIRVPNRRPELIYRQSTLRFRALDAIAFISRGNEEAKSALKRIIGTSGTYSKSFRKQVQDVLNRAEARK